MILLAVSMTTLIIYALPHFSQIWVLVLLYLKFFVFWRGRGGGESKQILLRYCIKVLFFQGKTRLSKNKYEEVTRFMDKERILDGRKIVQRKVQDALSLMYFQMLLQSRFFKINSFIKK